MVIVGRTNIPYNDLFILNLDERTALLEGYNINQRDLLYGLRRHALLTISPHVGKKANLTEYGIWPFDWEEETDSSYKATPGEIAKAKKMWEIVDKYKEAKNGKSAN
jgi:hypothetical protein